MLRDHKVYCCASPGEICSKLVGKVFEAPAGTPLSEKEYLLSERQDANGTLVRYLSDTPALSAQPVTPSLEDVFLSVYRDEKVGI